MKGRRTVNAIEKRQHNMTNETINRRVERAKLNTFLGELNYVHDCKIVDCDTMLSVYQGLTNNVPNDVIENFDYIKSNYDKSNKRVYIWCLRKVESNHD